MSVSLRPCCPALPAEGERENAPRRSEVCGLVYSPDSGQVRLNFQLAFWQLLCSSSTLRVEQANRAPEANDPASIHPVLKWF